MELKRGKKLLSILLVATMLLGMVPTGMIAIAADPPISTDIGQEDVFEAMGFDTSKMPEGFDEDSTSNPYGKNNVTINPVKEIFATRQWNTFESRYNSITEQYTVTETKHNGTVLYGHNVSSASTISSIYNNPVRKTLQDIFAYPNNEIRLEASVSMEGDFVGNGRKGQVVTVGAGDMSPNGGLYFNITRPEASGTPVTSNPIIGGYKELISKTNTIGNSGAGVFNEDFNSAPYLMQSYLKVSTGDFDGDGIDEIAVFVPEQGRSRIEVYKLKLLTSDLVVDIDGNPTDAAMASRLMACTDPTRWEILTTYYLRETTYVSNMVSLTSGDLNRDGVDDLALTWSYYFGPKENELSEGKAVVLFGENGKYTLTKITNIPLYYENVENKIARAAFTYGDIDGDNVDDLILGGQLAKDIEKGITSRFIAIYNFSGYDSRGAAIFTQNVAKNFDVLERDETGKFVRPGEVDGHFFSAPGLVTNLTAVRMNGIGKASSIYLDSLLIEYGDEGLVITTALDETVLGFTSTFNPHYVEYAARAVDLTGSGTETLQIMQLSLPGIDFSTLSVYEQFALWIYFYFGGPMPNVEATLFSTGIYGRTSGIATSREQVTRNEVFVESFEANGYANTVSESVCDFSYSYALPDTDGNDTALLRYTGQHYVTHTDPKILAVIASPPYFTDLDNEANELLTGSSYMVSETSYSSSKGTGSGGSTSHTLNVGAYLGFEHDFMVFSVKVASIEFEVAYNHGWTWETSKMKNMNQTITYSTLAGSDAIAFYSIPMEVYVYESLAPIVDSAGNFKKWDVQKMTVNIPHTASVVTMSLDDYEAIAKDYRSVLPQVEGNILTHKVGKPQTYPKMASQFPNALVYSGDPARMGTGLASITQELAIDEENSKGFTHTNTVDTKIGGGVWDIKAGITAGYEHNSGTVEVTTEGSSFSGQLYNMPIQAADYGYGYNWKIFCYPYEYNGTSFPVVNYLVNDVTAPPALPNDFRQVIEETTDKELTLTWSYQGGVSGFTIYRYEEYPDGAARRQIAFIPMSDGSPADSDGNRVFTYRDINLSPYTTYKYQIQTVRAGVPTLSVPSAVLDARTKSDVGYPNIELYTGAPRAKVDTSNPFVIYPDVESKITTVVENANDYNVVDEYNFQWQKKVGGKWENYGTEKSTLKFQGGRKAVVEGEYRCRVNVTYYDTIAKSEFLISAYSETVTVESRMRGTRFADDTLTVTEVTQNAETFPKFTAKVESITPGHQTIPSGKVIFTISGSNFSDYVDAILQGGVATAEYTKPLADGVYEIKAEYVGNVVFSGSETGVSAYYLAGNEVEGYTLVMNNKYIYGDIISPAVQRVTKTNGVTVLQETVEGATYKFGQIAVVGMSLRIVDITDSFTVGDTFVAAEGGNIIVQAYDTGKLIATHGISVMRKPITISPKLSPITVERRYSTHPTVSEALIASIGGLATILGDTIDDMGLRVFVTDAAGTSHIIDETTLPGVYTFIGAPSSTAGNSKYNKYEITYVSGQYIITGEECALSAFAERRYGERSGTVEMITPENTNLSGESWNTRITAGTNITLRAIPEPGFMVDKWYVNDAKVDMIESSLSYVFTMPAEAIDIKVTFKTAASTLTFGAVPEAGGKVTVTEGVEIGNSISENAQFTFKATPTEGWYFKNWIIYRDGFNSETKPPVTLEEDGTTEFAFFMGKTSTRIFATFERDAYTLTLGENLVAFKNFTDPDDNSKTLTEEVKSGAKVLGDTEIVVQPRIGFSTADDAVWYYNGEEADGTAGVVGPTNQSFTFLIAEDALVEVEVSSSRYTATLDIDEPDSGKNEADYTVDGALGADLGELDGGTELVFTAKPAWGYLFDKWIVEIDGSTSEYTAPELKITLGHDVAVMAVFIDNIQRQVKVLVPDYTYGTVKYKLNGGATKVLDDYMEWQVIDIFDGDTVEIIPTPSEHHVLKSWYIDGKKSTVTPAPKTWTLERITTNPTVEVEIISISLYTVNYGITGGDGSETVTGEIVRTMEILPFESGADNIGGGNRLLFTADYDVYNYMIVGWYITNYIYDEVPIPVAATTQSGALIKTDTLVIPAIANSMDVEAVLTEIVIYSITNSVENTVITVTPNTDHVALSSNEVLEMDGAVITLTAKTGYLITSTPEISGYYDIGDDDYWVGEDGTHNWRIKDITSDLEITGTTEQCYNINWPTGLVGGTVVNMPDKAVAGAEIELNVTPSLGYRFDFEDVNLCSVSYMGDIGNGTEEVFIPVEHVGDRWIFTMPSADVTVELDFEAILYTISRGSPVGGSVTSDYTAAYVSDIVKVTATANPNYAFSSWNVTYNDGTGAKLVTVQNGEFVMPAGNVTVTASFRSTGGGGGGGSVIIEDEAVALTEFKSFFAFIKGFDDNTFKGSKQISLEEFVVIMFRLKAPKTLPLFDTEAPSFADVAGDRWSYQEFEWANSIGLISADEEGNIYPATLLTRGDMAAMLVFLEKWEELADNIFTDIGTHAQRDDILKAVKAGVFNGYPDNTFKPNGIVTRNEVVAALVRYLLGAEPTEDMYKDLVLTFTDIDEWARKYIALAVYGYTAPLQTP